MFFLLIVVLTFLCTITVLAQNKVVVIPLMEEATGPPAPVPKTGQTTCSDGAGTTIDCAGTGQDGDIQAGVAWPNPRFVDHGNGTVTDNLTGLIWLKEGECSSFYAGDLTGQNHRNWEAGLNSCNQLADGFCDLDDVSQAGDWHLPNRKELLSLIDLVETTPALPAGCPLAPSTVSTEYLSATTYATNGYFTWSIDFNLGNINEQSKSTTNYVRCVR